MTTFLRRRVAAVACALLLMTTSGLTTGCAAAAQWWQGIVSNPGSALQLISYVLSLLEGIASLWSQVLPLIPASSQAAANTAFNNAVYTVEQSAAALQDAIRAAAAAGESNPNFATLVANVQAAVAALMNIYNQWTGGGAAPDGGATTAVSPAMPNSTDIVRQAGVIANWK
jgi:hypothetical protein